MAGIISGHRSWVESMKERMKKKVNKTKKKQQMVILLDDSDDDREANEDLTDEIIEKAKKRMRGIEELERDLSNDNVPNTSSVIEVSSSDGVEVIDEVAVADINMNLKRRKARERRKNKHTKKGAEDKLGVADETLGEEDKVRVTDVKSVLSLSLGEEDKLGVADGTLVEEDKVGVTDVKSVLSLSLGEEDKIVDENVGILNSPEAMAEEDAITDNTVLRKLLRGPRYFDPPGESWGACYNCGEVGHAASRCLVKKQKKPCYICGKFGHAAKSCSEMHACFICKRTGHRAKNCSDKKNVETLRFCLRCGSVGHDMSTCKNDYALDDLKEIQCYVCRHYGHLCCTDFVDTGPSVVSCYNCGQIGHTGSGCARDKNGSTLCYKCGEEGHLARGCNKLEQSEKQLAEPSTPLCVSAENDDFLGFKSAPYDSIRSQESWGPRHHGCRKLRRKNEWITNGADSPSRNVNLNEWGSPITPFEKGQWNSDLRYHGFQSSYIPCPRSSKFRYNELRSSYTPGFWRQRFRSDASSSWMPRQHAKFAYPT